MTKQKALHYHLVCGTLMCANEDGDISSISLNAILPTEEKFINVPAIGKAQQALQMNFHQRMQGEDAPKVNVVDVVIASISYLGLMTPEKFNETPEGMKLEERQAPTGFDPFSDPAAAEEIAASAGIFSDS